MVADLKKAGFFFPHGETGPIKGRGKRVLASIFSASRTARGKQACFPRPYKVAEKKYKDNGGWYGLWHG
jgi:hypothetical protein